MRLLILLRLAVLLNRSRSAAQIPPVKLTVARRSLSLEFDADWLTENPLTIADLDRERQFLAAVGYALKIR
jgi:exopolyphosphatase/guanosine-5'-triphosphate,3'-diphosphate pyrophosphatase